MSFKFKAISIFMLLFISICALNVNKAITINNSQYSSINLIQTNLAFAQDSESGTDSDDDENFWEKLNSAIDNLWESIKDVGSDVASFLDDTVKIVWQREKEEEREFITITIKEVYCIAPNGDTLNITIEKETQDSTYGSETNSTWSLSISGIMDKVFKK